MPTPPLRVPLNARLDAATVFDALYADSPNAFWLDSGAHASSGMSYLGDASAVLAARTWGELEAGLAPEGLGGASFSPAPVQAPAGRDARAGAPRFALGWVGWLTYELGSRDEERAARAPSGEKPRAVLLRVDRAVEVDHSTGAVALLARDTPDAPGWLTRTAAILESFPLRLATDDGSIDDDREARARHGFDEYAAMVEECRAIIARGEAYQLCLTNSFEVEGRFDPVAVHRRLRAGSPTVHGGFVRAAGVTLVSASPEQFLAVTPGGRVVTKPVKGTRRRDPDPTIDRSLADELAASEKERAENLMIVDLMRNDLARVCELGSVHVEELLQVESLAQVHQLVSTVAGTLAPGRSAFDALAACFPAGSMTGTPKRSAMSHLARLEGAPRGLYSGVFGYLSDDGAAEFAMVIRSVVISADGASVGAGGGITALSEPEAEVEETRLKASAVLAALGARLPPWAGDRTPRIRD